VSDHPLVWNGRLDDPAPMERDAPAEAEQPQAGGGVAVATGWQPQPELGSPAFAGLPLAGL